MAISGAKFLELNKARRFTIAKHALDRIREHTGIDLTPAVASVLFRRSRHISAATLYGLGYRPAYYQRQARGERTWYFRFAVFGAEQIAVLAEGDAPGELVWVTTYGPDAQTQRYRLTELDAPLASGA